MLVGVDGLQLREGHGQPVPFPADGREHLVRAFCFTRHADDIDLIVDAER